MARKSTHRSASTDTARPANLGAFASALDALSWGIGDASDKATNSLGNMLLSLICIDIEATLEAIRHNEPDLHLLALESDCDRLAHDYIRGGLEQEGPGFVILLGFILDRIRGVAA